MHITLENQLVGYLHLIMERVKIRNDFIWEDIWCETVERKKNDSQGILDKELHLKHHEGSWLHGFKSHEKEERN